jgi:hypothetical protein
MRDETKDRPKSSEHGEQPPEEVARLMELTRDHYERAYGVRPAIILDATRENADWIRDPPWWGGLTAQDSDEAPADDAQPEESR